MSNRVNFDIEQYYKEQVGSGLAHFSGVRIQKGHGWFGRLLKGVILPALGFMGRRAMTTGLDVAEYVLGGEDLRSSVKKRVPSSIKRAASEGVAHIRKTTGLGLQHLLDNGK